MSKPVLPPQMASRRRSRARRTVARLALAATVARTVVRTRFQRDQALRDLGAARTLLRREGWLEHELREVAAAAASGEISEHDLADMAASRLKNLLGSITAAVRRADPEGLTLIGYAGPPSSPPRLRWDERTSAAQAIRTRRLARVEQYGPPTAAGAAFVAAHALTCGISAPVQIEGRTWGSITVTTARTAGFSTEEEQLLDRFAQLVAAPLATAHAHEQITFRARLEEALREVAAASVSADVDERTLATLVAERVLDLLGANHRHRALWARRNAPARDRGRPRPRLVRTVPSEVLARARCRARSDGRHR
jgi:GAF domain-containing protein